MADPAVLKAVEGSEDWDVFDAPADASAIRRRVKAIKLTATTSGSTAMNVTKADGTTGTTGELGLHVLEPMAGITAVNSIGAGVDEYRVYYE